jgi:hypothetical protein
MPSVIEQILGWAYGPIVAGLRAAPFSARALSVQIISQKANHSAAPDFPPRDSSPAFLTKSVDSTRMVNGRSKDH